ncbi:MAG: hypothetical protein IJQ78_05055 [Selenomonadaceae bacterium]|nr:hypothetical protein [Selenomonadaceae bacterium]
MGFPHSNKTVTHPSKSLKTNSNDEDIVYFWMWEQFTVFLHEPTHLLIYEMLLWLEICQQTRGVMETAGRLVI